MSGYLSESAVLDNLRTILVEDHTIVRQGLRPLLQSKGLLIVGEAADGIEAVKLAKRERPNLIIIDLVLPKLDGFEAIARIRKMLPDAKIIALTVHGEPPFVYRAFDAGADAFLVKESSFEELMEALESVMRGKKYVSKSFPREILESHVKRTRRLRKADLFSVLTIREREILQHIAAGRTSREIAEALFISKKTVENHRANIMKKLEIHDTAGLVRYAIKIGLVH